MSLTDTINNDLKQAMRDKDTLRLEAIRALRGEVIKLAKSGQQEAVTDSDVIQQVKVLIKQRQDSIAMFDKAGRDDLARKERDQIGVLQQYLPPQFDEAALTDLIDEVIAAEGASGMRDMGKVMAALQERIRASGKDADNRMVAQLVKSRLSA